MNVEVADVDEVHARAIRQRLEIVYPLTDEPWGVRRFFVVDPNGTVLNILSHIPSSGVKRISKESATVRTKRPLHRLTTNAQKPSIVIEQATSPYSFRFSELSQPA